MRQPGARRALLHCPYNDRCPTGESHKPMTGQRSHLWSNTALAAESPYARAREGVTATQHVAGTSLRKAAHVRVLTAPNSERASTTPLLMATYDIDDLLELVPMPPPLQTQLAL